MLLIQKNIATETSIDCHTALRVSVEQCNAFFTTLNAVYDFWLLAWSFWLFDFFRSFGKNSNSKMAAGPIAERNQGKQMDVHNNYSIF